MVYNLSSPEFLAEPSYQLGKMREDAPLVRVRLPIIGKTWVTTNDAAARHVLKSSDLFVRDPSRVAGQTLAQKYWYFPRFIKPLFQNMLAVDGADHKRLRGLVETAFARTSIDALKPDLTGIADGLLDGIAPDNTVEIISAYARQLPLLAICALLGVKQEDTHMIARWIAPLSGPTNALSVALALPGLRRVMRYFTEAFEEVRRNPRAGLMTELAFAEAEGDKLSEDELLAMVVTLFIAGHETTVHLITMGIVGILQTPEAQAALQGSPDQRTLLIEEIMRFYAPVMMTKPHFALQDTEFEGIKIGKGEMVVALLIAANHDPARFEAPEEFVAQRRPNAHLGFGHGPHVCLGMQLARAEAQIALTQLFTRFPRITLARPEEPLDFTKRVGVHGLKRLHLRLSD